MDKQRYLVVIVRPPSEVTSMTPGRRSSLLVPFSPEAIINAFVEELWKRLARHDGAIPLTAETHEISLRLGDETGPCIDIEDILADVIADTQQDKIFAVFRKKRSTAIETQAKQVAPSLIQENDHEDDVLSFRIITSSTTRNQGKCPVLKLPVSATIHQLHSSITDALGCTAEPQETVEAWECNCTLAKEIASGPSTPNHFLVIHGKSVVEKLPLEVSTVGCLQQALFARFGQDLDTGKEVTYEGAVQDTDDSRIYRKTPVVSVCSKQRHVPVHARVDLDGNDRTKPQVLDLHTSELPIHPACFESNIKTLGLAALAVDGIVDIFAVFRTSSAKVPLLKGKSAIFRDLAHWEPSIAQSDRGMAMFLSSLRVFTSIVQNMEGDESARDAAYYAFHELTNFPPALRCLHILVSGQTPTMSDCAALSQSMLEVLKSYMPMEAITLDPARLFEGSRLAFGFILESAKSIRKSADGDRGNDEEVVDNLRYTSAFHTYDVRDHQTREPVLHALQTSNGLMESELFHSLQSGGILAETHLHASLARAEIDPRLRRFALQGGGTCPEVLVLSLGGLKDCYGSQEEGVTPSALDLDQLLDLNHLAILSGQSGLAVHMPSQLISAIAPSLVFDRNAHVAVYTGEQPCAAPGRSSIISRPQHGEETIDPSVIEQLIAPIIKQFEQDGSAVFDAFGGAEVRRLQDPDEIIMFCVDSSASMGGETDFREVNQESPRLDEQSHSPAEGELHTALSLEMTKESLIAYEGFTDMISIIATALNHQQNLVTGKVLSILASMLSSEIITKSKALEKEQKSAIGPSWVTRISDLESNLQKLKAFGSGLKVHEEAVAQFLRYRASCLNVHGWMWSVGDPVPAVPGRKTIPILPHDMTEVPSHLKCPISHCLMEDAVKASDGQIYSRSAIQQWFAIRKTSPLHGAPLRDLSLAVEPDIRYEVVSWIAGTAMRSPSDVITVTFESRVGSFTRNIARTTTSRDLYRLAYRGLKARYEAFELSMHWFGMLSASSDIEVSSMRLRDFDHVMVRIPEDADTSQVRPHNAPRTVGDQTPEMCLVKVFEHTKSQLFGFWVPRDTTDTLTSIIWKYWRHQLHENPYLEPSRRQARTNVTEFGDGWYSCDYPEDATKLATYLTTDRCTGQLEPESVFKGSSANTSGSQSIHKVLKVIITKPNKVARSQKLTRLDVLKQMFEALINRMLAYNYRNHVGLVKFSSHAQVTMPISHVLENFRRATNELKGGGDTALWDALALAGDQIEQYASRFPGAKKRIVVISDGVDTNSKTNTSHSITLGLFQKGISVDSVSLGGEDNVDLRTLSYLLGSYRFHPTSLSNALAICEMEPFLSLSQRPSITFPPRNLASPARFETVFYQSRTWATATLVTDETIPPIREHPNMEDDVVQLTTLASRRNATARGLGDSSSASNGSVRSRLRVPRLMNEIKTVAARGAHGSYDVYISTADMSFWKIVVGGPDGSPYSDGAFLLYLHADDGYPTFAPKARFVTKIRHPNVNAHGRICHSIFDRDWTSDTSMGAILDTIYGLLFQPESSDPVSTMSTLGFFQEPAAFAREAREHTRKHASKTREEWKAELLD